LQYGAAKARGDRGRALQHSVKIGPQMARRFWETDDYIYGGHSFTSQDIALVSYPNYHLFEDGPGVLLGAFATGAGAYRLAGMTPEQRIQAALAQGAVFHPETYTPRNSRTAPPSPGIACPGP
jgi:monoamine oxidase